jgi:hypothetical protein
VQAWRAAAPDKAGDAAFRAIASDQGLLLRMRKMDANALARNAEMAMAGLEVLSQQPGSSLAEVCAAVRRRIDHFRTFASRGIREGVCPADEPAAAQAPPDGTVIPENYRAVWRNAFAHYPQFDEATGAAVAAVLGSLGGEELCRLEPPMDEIFAAVGARFAARCARGLYRSKPVTREDCVGVIGVVQEWAVRKGQVPLMVGLGGRFGSFPDRAATLAMDALACLGLAAELPGGEAAEGYGLWETAAETHSYTALMVKPSMLLAMEYDAAQTLAANAARFAKMAASDPQSCQIPEVPEEDSRRPHVVLAAALRILPDGVPPRRSEASQSDPVPGQRI